MADSPEESSWTFYIQGFICDNNNDNDHEDIDNNSCDEFESPSLVSDADSSAVVAKKFVNHNLNWTQEPLGFSSSKNNRTTILSKQNSFKKQKTSIIPAMDLALEDTASSPVNSPKVSYMNQFMNHEKREKAKMMDVSEVKRNGFGKVFGDYVDLKKRSSFGN